MPLALAFFKTSIVLGERFLASSTSVPSISVAISLISLGLSRVAALFLKRRIDLSQDSTPEDCLTKLRSLQLDAMTLPVYCRRELRALGFGH